jgi:hypothetical protein
MDIQTSFSLTPALARRAFARSGRRVWIFTWCASAALILLGVLLHSYSLIVLGVVYAVFPFAIIRLKTRSRRNASTVLVHLTDVDVQWREQNVASRVAWTHARSVQRRGDFWIIKFPGVRTPLPISAFPPAAVAEIEAFFQARGLMRGGGRTPSAKESRSG